MLVGYIICVGGPCVSYVEIEIYILTVGGLESKKLESH